MEPEAEAGEVQTEMETLIAETTADVFFQGLPD
jgi:hypothetical protein